jgi:hypothetical protein
MRAAVSEYPRVKMEQTICRCERKTMNSVVYNKPLRKLERIVAHIFFAHSLCKCGTFCSTGRTTFLTRLAALTLLLQLMAGCQYEETAGLPSRNANQPSSSGTAPPLDSCTVLTRADVESVLGVGVGEGQTQTSEIDGHKTCRYNALKDGPGPREVTFDLYQPATLSLVKEGLHPSVASYFKKQREQLAAHVTSVTEVPGLGDSAYWERRRLHALKGDVYVTVMVTIGGVSASTEEQNEKQVGPQALGLSQSLAQKAFSKL